MAILVKKYRGRVRSEVLMYFRRHEDIWEEMLRLTGWRIVKRFEVPLRTLVEVVQLYNEVAR